MMKKSPGQTNTAMPAKNKNKSFFLFFFARNISNGHKVATRRYTSVSKREASRISRAPEFQCAFRRAVYEPPRTDYDVARARTASVVPVDATRKRGIHPSARSGGCVTLVAGVREEDT